MDLHATVLFASVVSNVPLDASPMAFIILYIGPEIILPLASFIASAIGLLLMFWRQVTKAVRKMFRHIFRRNKVLTSSSSDLDTLVEETDIEEMDIEEINEHADLEPLDVEKADINVQG